MGRYLPWTAGVIAVWALLIAILPQPARQVAAVCATLAMLLAALLGCLYAIYRVLCLFEKPPQRVQFNLRSLFVLISVTGVVLFAATNFRPVFEYLLGAVFCEETIYSPGYSMLGWRQVRAGMSKSRVVELCGPPLTKSSRRGREVWEYTSYGPSETYHRREVYLSNDIVTGKLGELWLD